MPVLAELHDKIRIAVGEHAEGMPWEIDPQCQIMRMVNHRYPDDWELQGGERQADDPIPCEHCVEVARKEEYNRPDPRHRWTIVTYQYPAIVAHNEGGYNETAICLSCLLDALRQHGLLDADEKKAH